MKFLSGLPIPDIPTFCHFGKEGTCMVDATLAQMASTWQAEVSGSSPGQTVDFFL